MSDRRSEQGSSTSDTSLVAVKQRALNIARAIASVALDPHGYFELHYTARIEKAQTQAEIEATLASLFDWTRTELSPVERRHVDAALVAANLPTLDDLESTAE